MPSRVRACGAMRVSTSPSNSMVPPRAGRRPMMPRMSVVFPAPLRPIRPAIMPLGRSNATARRMLTDPIDTSSPLILSIGVACFLCQPDLGPADHVAANLLVGEHRGGHTIGENTALVERHHALRVTAHDVHVVLDEQHGHTIGSHGVHDAVHDVELLVAADPAGWLVQ